MSKQMRLGLLIMFFAPLAASAQGSRSYAGEVKKIVNVIKSTKDVAYRYSMNATYPNGQTDRIAGQLYLGNEDKLMYNANDAFTMIYNGKWFYKADHRNKSVVILNIDKHLNKNYKDGLEKDMFQNNSANVFTDSVVMKYASISKLKKYGDTVHIDLVFPDQIPIKRIGIVYDEKERMLISYSIRTFQPWSTNEFGKNKGTTIVISCSDFEKITDNTMFLMNNFFSVNNNKVSLKKYETYKLNVKL